MGIKFPDDNAIGTYEGRWYEGTLILKKNQMYEFGSGSLTQSTISSKTGTGL